MQISLAFNLQEETKIRKYVAQIFLFSLRIIEKYISERVWFLFCWEVISALVAQCSTKSYEKNSFTCHRKSLKPRVFGSNAWFFHKIFLIFASMWKSYLSHKGPRVWKFSNSNWFVLILKSYHGSWVTKTQSQNPLYYGKLTVHIFESFFK